jgi:hypothetical protein
MTTQSFLKEFNDAYYYAAEYFLMDQWKTFDTVEDVKVVIERLQTSKTFLKEISQLKVLSPYHKNIIDVYNNLAEVVNAYSSIIGNLRMEVYQCNAEIRDNGDHFP